MLGAVFLSFQNIFSKTPDTGKLPTVYIKVTIRLGWIKSLRYIGMCEFAAHESRDWSSGR